MSVRSIFLIMFVLLTFNCLANEPRKPEYKPDEILVQFAPKEKGLQRNASEKAQILQSENCGKVKQSYKIVPGLVHVKLPKDVTVEIAIQRLSKCKRQSKSVARAGAE